MAEKQSTRRLNANDMDPYIGSELGGCTIGKRLGRGGMATVYLGRQQGLDRDVAVKILASRLTQNERQVEQFFREAKTVAKLEHPNVVSIYGVGQEEEAKFLIMQLVAGGSLHKLLKERGGVLPVDEATDYVRQIARGLAQAHNKGIVHRDIKPGNILVAPGPQMKITDFGLALMNDGTEDAFSEGRIVGTPHYMSPEQVDARPVDARTDIYALGATFYHLVVGKPPFSADAPVELLIKHVSEPVVPPHKRNPEIPETLSRVIVKMMAKNPAVRFQTCDDVLKALDAPNTVGAEAKKDEASPTLLLGRQDLKPLAALYNPVRPKRPPSFMYATAGFLVLAIGLLVLGLGPLQAVLGQERAAVEPVDRKEVTATEALTRLKGSLKTAKLPVRVKRLKAFAQDYPKTAAAEEATAAIAPLEQQLQDEANAALTILKEQVTSMRGEGKLGPALDSIAQVRPEVRSRIDVKELKTLRTAVEADLAQQGFVWVPAGKFVRGEGRRRRESFVQAYYMQAREVSCADYARFLATSPEGVEDPPGWEDGQPPEGREDLPVTGVTAREAIRYATWAKLSLPTSDQWEKAARGPEGARWPWGEQAEPSATNWGAPGKTAELVRRGSFPKDRSPFGCLDMAGNAAELTLGRRSTLKAPRVWVRGGSIATRMFANTRSAFYLDRVSPDARHRAVGFRCAAETLPKGAK